MAGLIPQSFIDDLLGRIDLVEVIGSRLSLKKTGKNHSARCPFHDEKSPSFTVSPDKQFYYCFGCGATGNAISFLMEYDHLDFVQAVEELARRAGVDVPREDNRSASASSTASTNAPLYSLLAEASDFYRLALKSHPGRHLAVNYLKSRGLSGIIARDFALGFAPPGWDNLLKRFGQTEPQQKALLDAGLLVENADSGKRYDRFRDRIIFPIRDSRGRVMAFGGRVLGDDKPKYLNSPESPVFHKGRELYGLYEVQKFNRHLTEVMVVEGYMDVIALAQQGLRNAVAVLGTATTEEHIRRLFRLAPSILFCFDGDLAGRKAAWRALEATLPQLQDGYLARFLFLPEGEDPDSLVRREGPEAFQARIQQQAQSLVDYCFQQSAEGINLRSLEGKAQLGALVSPLIEKVPGLHLRALMHQHLTQLTGLEHGKLTVPPTQEPLQNTQNTTAGTLRTEQQRPQASPKPANTPSPRSWQPRQLAEQALAHSRPAAIVESPILTALRTLLRHPELAGKVEDASNIDSEDDHTQLLIALLSALQKNPQLSTLQLMARWHGTEQGRILRTLAEKEWLISDDNLEQQFFDTINSLVARQREYSLEALLHKARESELSIEEKNQLRRLLQRGSSLTQTTSAGTKGQV